MTPPAVTDRPAATDATATAPAAWRGQPLRAVLFDLDGTLLDTAGDISLALRRAMAEHGWPAVPEADVRRMIGRGAPTLVTRAATSQGRTLEPALHAAVLDRFFHHYGALQTDDEVAAEPYPGARDAVHRVHAAGLKVAVVTNKQQVFAVGLLRRMGFIEAVDLVVGGDTCERRKPDPQPIQHACQVLGVSLAETLMVGDSVNDVSAARAAGVPVVCVPYGYNEGNDPRTLDCDALVDTLAELPGLIGLR